MSRESHREFLKRSAQRTLARERERRHKERWSAQEVRRLKIQTVEPWKRIILAVLGAAATAGGFVALSNDEPALGIALFVVALLLFLVAAYGIRKTIEGLTDSIDVVDFIGGIVDIFD
jgi:hypothetical protein